MRWVGGGSKAWRISWSQFCESVCGSDDEGARRIVAMLVSGRMVPNVGPDDCGHVHHRLLEAEVSLVQGYGFEFS